MLADTTVSDYFEKIQIDYGIVDEHGKAKYSVHVGKKVLFHACSLQELNLKK